MYLIMYEGGGYDGCRWEPNYFLTDAEFADEITEFHDIYSSGFRGIKTLEQAQKMNSEEWHCFDLDAMGWQQFRDPVQTSAYWAFRIARLLNSMEFLCKTFLLQCWDCKQEIENGCEVLIDTHRDGGVGVIADHALCLNCHSIREKTALIAEIKRYLWDDEKDRFDDMDDEIVEKMIRQVTDFKLTAQYVAEYLMDNFDNEHARAINEDQQMDLEI